jgi:hypothetical protein
MQKWPIVITVGAAAFVAFATIADPFGWQRDELPGWIASAPKRAMSACPLEEPAGTSDVPYFDFGPGEMDSCLLDGPYSWENNSWFMQRIKGFTPKPKDPANPPADFDGRKRDLIRVCSFAAVRDTDPPKVQGPCHTQKGVGKNGCQVCSSDFTPYL